MLTGFRDCVRHCRLPPWGQLAAVQGLAHRLVDCCQLGRRLHMLEPAAPPLWRHCTEALQVKLPLACWMGTCEGRPGPRPAHRRRPVQHATITCHVEAATESQHGAIDTRQGLGLAAQGQACGLLARVRDSQ